ncbi:TonB-dependent receptor domain-containing protein [Massilia terrae]|uniref:TonB-dependent receptor n=1 Tax=Massilia terrae TaxID=1811224 RepID=A0ABT2CUV3_9BURK|nr:TonB-dependent receptor [Massilia terrae]MCS0657742.1 TonB-dependent receptor [Massilia terrae]
MQLLPALILGCFAAQPSFAQTTDKPVEPPPKVKAPATETPVAKVPVQGEPEKVDGGVATIEVVAARTAIKVDRDVYDVKSDISASNASAADILNNIPSVTVDQDGNLALRGNQNVQVMINGKRDAQFQGRNRGDILNAFPADSIESIEVINVPGAEFGNEGGSGPIINIILKRNRKAGTRGVVSANKGSGDRYNASANGEHAEGPYSISGNIGIRRDVRTTHRESQREDLDAQTGNVTGGSNSDSDTRQPMQSVSMGTNFNANVGERDQASATASFSKVKNRSDSLGNTYRYNAAVGPTSDYSSSSHSVSPSQNFGLGTSYNHKSGEPGEELKFDARYSGQTNNADSDVWYDYRLRPTRYTSNNHRETGRRNRIFDISTDYTRVVWETWQLKAGGKVATSKASDSTNYLAVNPLTGNYEPVPSRISDFESNDRNAAIYGTLSTKPMDKVAVLAGLRGEYTTMDVVQPLLGQEYKYHYLNWLPSFYATYDVSDTGMLHLRSSRRIARPNERDLNPNLVYYSDFSARQGNPNLVPVSNASYELAYRDRFFNVDSNFVLFRRVESQVIGNRSTPLATDSNVIVTAPINFGSNNSTGLDLNFNVRRLFLDGLSINLSTVVSNDRRQRLFNLSTTQIVEQSVHRESAKLRLAYQDGPESLQLTVNHVGPSLSGQGLNHSFTMTNFSWQHKFTPQLSFNLNINNVFHGGNMESVTGNEILRVHGLTLGQPSVFYAGLRYQFGGVTGDPRIRGGGGSGGARTDGGRGF